MERFEKAVDFFWSDCLSGQVDSALWGNTACADGTANIDCAVCISVHNKDKMCT